MEVAARLIGEIGYEALTMTALSENAGASIGTLYDYFPDKQALTQALTLRYAEEADAHWKKLLSDLLPLTQGALADVVVDGAVAFVSERPDYVPLFSSPPITFRSPLARQHLRQVFANALRRTESKLSKERALLRAQVIVELIKSLLAMLKQVTPSHREVVTEDFKLLIHFYLLGLPRSAITRTVAARQVRRKDASGTKA